MYATDIYEKVLENAADLFRLYFPRLRILSVKAYFSMTTVPLPII